MFLQHAFKDPSTVKASLLCFFLIAALSGCSAMFYDAYPKRSSSSMVQFLYPDGELPDNRIDALPRLELPLRIGIAFVPPRSSYGYSIADAEQVQLLNLVKEQFEGEDYVESIDVIPSAYLQGASGFQALEQAGGMFDLDVFALVSWNQVVLSSDTPASVLYWTIVGAYVIPGTRNSVNTLLDTAVFDIKTHKLLLRAPGVSQVTDSSTAVEAGRVTLTIREDSFVDATNQMAKNLEAEVELFGKRIKEDGVAEITYASDYKGAFSPLLLLFGSLLGLIALVRRRPH